MAGEGGGARMEEGGELAVVGGGELAVIGGGRGEGNGRDMVVKGGSEEAEVEGRGSVLLLKGATEGSGREPYTAELEGRGFSVRLLPVLAFCDVSYSFGAQSFSRTHMQLHPASCR